MGGSKNVNNLQMSMDMLQVLLCMFFLSLMHSLTNDVSYRDKSVDVCSPSRFLRPDSERRKWPEQPNTKILLRIIVAIKHTLVT